ncbi:MAG: sigma-70 family RNA polymerase sigma factor [Verrucomicrobia bacterium]|nr:MAG: sigma-70 family RNA polymerase sigma factor [Verrucomicrobiota bacterium]
MGGDRLVKMSDTATETDLQLLARYTRDHAEDAFAEIVRRHVDLIHSAALRQVRSPQLAEEVAQSAFTDLARNANKLKPDTILAAWLYRVTHRTAVDVVRREARRQLREQIATELNAMNATTADWTHIEPLLDDAMSALDETDRAAVLLRYFENKSLREVGATLGTSDDAAQKRVSRAVERLREFFAKRGVTVAASGLVVVLSANAVQAAPAGLAVTISTAGILAGASVQTATTIAATKAIAMTTLQKTLIATTLAAAVGTGIFEAHQASNLRTEVQTLQQQQAPLTEQIQQLTRERDDATRQLAALREENERLNRNSAELLKLRGEVGVLRNAARASMQANPADASMEAAAKSWLNRANQLKQYVEQNPNEKIPEFQFLTDREWLILSGDTGLETEDFRTQDDYRRGVELLRLQAETKFAHRVQEALRKYSSANNGQFPTGLSQLQPYCEPIVGDLLLQLYEIKPSTVLSTWLVKDNNIKTDWVITRMKPVNSNSTSRLAIFTDGNAYWQSPR